MRKDSRRAAATRNRLAACPRRRRRVGDCVRRADVAGLGPGRRRSTATASGCSSTTPAQRSTRRPASCGKRRSSWPCFGASSYFTEATWTQPLTGLDGVARLPRSRLRAGPQTRPPRTSPAHGVAALPARQGEVGGRRAGRRAAGCPPPFTTARSSRAPASTPASVAAESPRPTPLTEY